MLGKGTLFSSILTASFVFIIHVPVLCAEGDGEKPKTPVDFNGQALSRWQEISSENVTSANSACRNFFDS